MGALIRRDRQGNDVGSAHRRAGGMVHRRPAQPGIDRAGGDLPGADGLHDRPRAVLHVAPGVDAWHLGHQGFRVGEDEAVSRLDRAAVEDRQVGPLTGGEDHVVALERQQAGGVELRIELSGLVVDLLAELEGRLAVLPDADRAPPGVQLHAFPDGVLDLVGAGRHLAAVLQRDHVDVRCALAQGRQGDVDRDVAAADDDHPRPDPHRLAAAHVPQEIDAAEHEGLMDTLDRDQARALGAEAEEHGVVVLAEGVEASDLRAGADRDSERPDLVELLVEQVGRQAVGRNAVAQHAAGLLLLLEDLDLVTEASAGSRRR